MIRAGTAGQGFIAHGIGEVLARGTGVAGAMGVLPQSPNVDPSLAQRTDVRSEMGALVGALKENTRATLSNTPMPRVAVDSQTEAAAR